MWNVGTRTECVAAEKERENGKELLFTNLPLFICTYIDAQSTEGSGGKCSCFWRLVGVSEVLFRQRLWRRETRETGCVYII